MFSRCWLVLPLLYWSSPPPRQLHQRPGSSFFLRGVEGSGLHPRSRMLRRMEVPQVAARPTAAQSPFSRRHHLRRGLILIDDLCFTRWRIDRRNCCGVCSASRFVENSCIAFFENRAAVRRNRARQISSVQRMAGKLPQALDFLFFEYSSHRFKWARTLCSDLHWCPQNLQLAIPPPFRVRGVRDGGIVLPASSFVSAATRCGKIELTHSSASTVRSHRSPSRNDRPNWRNGNVEA